MEHSLIAQIISLIHNHEIKLLLNYANITFLFSCPPIDSRTLTFFYKEGTFDQSLKRTSIPCKQSSVCILSCICKPPTLNILHIPHRLCLLDHFLGFFLLLILLLICGCALRSVFIVFSSFVRLSFVCFIRIVFAGFQQILVVKELTSSASPAFYSRFFLLFLNLTIGFDFFGIIFSHILLAFFEKQLIDSILQLLLYLISIIIFLRVLSFSLLKSSLFFFVFTIEFPQFWGEVYT